MRGRSVGGAIGLGIWALTLGGCDGSPLGDQVQRSLEPDSQLEEAPPFGQPSPAPEEAPPEASPTPTPPTPPRDSDPIGPTPPPARPNSRPPALNSLPEDLRPYVQDLLRLEADLLTTVGESRPPGPTSAPADWLNQPISRRHYARWLFALNNRFYTTVPAKRLRPGNRSATPAFQDVPPSDPDFGAIQGLAEAGILPSTLSGNTTAVTFRPNDPLTRETLVLWKIPLDIRAALPATTPATVAETWGFQDLNTIDPLALRAIAADFQLGDFANIRRAFGFTTLLQPRKAVTHGEAAAALWRFGDGTEGVSAADLLSQEPSTSLSPRETTP